VKRLAAIDDAFAAAERAVSQSRALVRSKAAEAASLPIPSSGGALSDPASQRMAADAREALQHFRGWVFCAVRAIAQRIAGLPIAVERKGTSPRTRKAPGQPSAEWQPVEESHPLAALWRDPCEIMPRPSLLFSYVASLELTGRGLLLIDGEGADTKLWPIPTSWATPQHLPGKPFDSWTLQAPNSTETMEIVAEDMIYSAYPDPSNPMGSVSPLEAAGLAVLADEKLQTSQLAAFDNNCLPGVAVIVGDVQRPGLPDARPVLKRHQREAIIRSVRLMHTGAWRAREPWILDGFVRDVKPITTAPAEMDFKDSGDVLKRRILAAFGVSPAVLGELTDANRASSAEAEGHFARSTLAPKCELVSAALTEWLCPRFAAKGETLRIRIATPEIQDPEVVRTNVESLARIGAISRNEARSILLGLPALPNGDAPMVPFNLVPEA